MSKLTKPGGFFKEFFNSIGAIFIGLLMILLCVFGLARNELSNVKNIRALKEVSKNFIQIESSVDSSNNNRLVAARGQLSFTPVTDRDYPVENNSFVIRRQVEVSQWREIKSNKEGVPPTYSLVWSTSPINSANFPSENKNPAWPTGDRLKSNTVYSNDVRMGEFNLTNNHLTRFSADTNVKINIEDPENMFRISTYNDVDYFTDAPSADKAGEAGKIRISFYKSNVSRASVLAKQNGENFDAYFTKNKISYNRAFAGFLTGEEMVQRLETERKIMTGLLRILFCVFICIGFILMFSPIKLLVRYIPLLGKWLGKATQVVARVVGCVLGIILSLIVICISWVMVRPLVAIPLIVVLVGIVYLMTRKRFEGGEATDPLTEPAFATNTGAPATDTRFCANCGAKLDSNTAFCPQCGTRK